jgi:hypothetical protein
MNIENIKNSVDKDIKVIKFREHSKASEKYIDVEIYENSEIIWNGSIPYFYRRTGLFIEDEQSLIEYLNKIKIHFSKDNINTFIVMEKKRWEDEMSGKKTTKGFFDILLNMKWNSIDNDLPNNPNWARRIQDIKEFGYTLATNTNMRIENSEEKGTHILLVPLPKGAINGYEVMSEEFKKKAIKALKSINSFEAKKVTHGLIPDHKFPEIRWDTETKECNENLTEDEITTKFQLLDNQRNLQKREVCRQCFQTKKRGLIFGINYFYKGNENWSIDIPQVGKDAEKGCEGCAWYDIEAWRDSLNKAILEKNN